MSAEWDESDYRRQADADLAALAARPAPDDGEALPGPLDDRCGCRRSMGRRDPACHSYGLCGHTAPSSPPSGDALHGRLAEAPRAELARGTAWYAPTGQSIADALLPVVRAYADRRAGMYLSAAADWADGQSSHAYDEDDEAYEHCASELRAMASALAAREREA